MATDRDQDGHQDGSDIRARRERYGMLEGWLQDALDREQKRSVGPEEQRVFEAMQVWLKSYNEMVRRMTEALRKPAPDLDSLIDSVTEHSGPAHILPGPAGLETLWEALATRPDIPCGPEPGFPLGPGPPKDATEDQPSDDGLTWRQKPAQF
jgi:hypothetical protein